ncbi:MAG TPA: hypothetical protein VG963_22130 [Polyangiaceae bacterium]|nr:hypothetical protein [Polyangiaceae bacterium]
MLQQLQHSRCITLGENDALSAVDDFSSGRQNFTHDEAGYIQTLMSRCACQEAFFLTGSAKLDPIVSGCGVCGHG